MLILIWTIAIGGQDMAGMGPYRVGDWRCFATDTMEIRSQQVRAVVCVSGDHRVSTVAACSGSVRLDANVLVVDNVTVGIKCEVRSKRDDI